MIITSGISCSGMRTSFLTGFGGGTTKAPTQLRLKEGPEMIGNMYKTGLLS